VQSKRAEAETLLEGERRLLEMVATGAPVSDVLDGLCVLVERVEAGCCCTVLLVDRSGTRFQHGAAPSLPDSFARVLHGRFIDVDNGPCGMAASLNQQVLAVDIASDSRWQNSGWNALAMAHGLASCWSTPIVVSGGTVVGTFALYWRTPASPTAAHRLVVERTTHLAAVAIEGARREAALRQHQAFLAEAQRISATGSFLWRVAAGEIVWTEQTYRIYELDPSRPVDFALVSTRIHPDEATWFNELIARASQTGEDLEFEHRLLMTDQSVKHLHVVAHATREQGGLLEYIGAVQDVTDRHRASDALNQLRAELASLARVATLGTLTAAIAHEVNQPLAGIVTNAGTSLRMLADDPPDVEGARETARRAIRDANRAADVIARLRSLFTNSPRQAEHVDLNDATKDVISILAGELQRSGASVRLELHPALPRVVADRVQLQQVVLNLVVNAAEAMSRLTDRPRVVTLRTARGPADDVHLSVADAGPGFLPEDVQRLFEPFYTTKAEGMGVGLSISRSIVESHGGRLWASLNEGFGATFAFAVPISPPTGGHLDDPPARPA
jgi:C4-dicarboxylate-specific signal transduction histidine kinase